VACRTGRTGEYLHLSACSVLPRNLPILRLQYQDGGTRRGSFAISPCARSRDRLVASLIKHPPSIGRLHWGGGTPSILGLDGLESVLAVLASHFPRDPSFEQAIELDPRYVTLEFADGLAALGVRRASLGVQDVNPLVQAAIGRIQPLSMVERTVKRLRFAGITNLNFDLIYGLPLQTPQSIRETCSLICAMKPDRIACFGYAHLPRLKANQRRIDETTLPSLGQRIDQAELVAEELVRRGYMRVGIESAASRLHAAADLMPTIRDEGGSSSG
jgi:oxygen-independent coproporphyrinogen-3 oxidase